MKLIMISLKLLLLSFTLVVLIKNGNGGVIHKRSLLSQDIKKEFETEVKKETETFLNNIFSNQIQFFNKVKSALPADSKRVKDIEQYVDRLNVAIAEKEVSKKDEIYIEAFKRMGDAPLLINQLNDTDISDKAYQDILDKSGLKDFMKNFLVDIAIYFWKMAKASGKAVEATMEEYLENLKNYRNSL